MKLASPIQWEQLEHARASRIAVYLDPADPFDRDNWASDRAWAIEALGEFRRVFGPVIDQLA